jgi:hypothetical protein
MNSPQIPPELLKILAQKMGMAGGAMGGAPPPPGMPLPGGVPGAPRQQPQSSAAPAYNIKNDPKAAVGNMAPPQQRPNPTSFQGSGPVGTLISLLGNWHSNKQKSENSEAANAAQALMQAIEGAKTSGDWTPAYVILQNNEKLFNKVYKGWLQKNELQAQEQQKKSKAKPPDPDVQGFEQGVQQFLQKKQQAPPPGPPPQGGAPKALGGYQLPAASPTQALGQQGVSAERQAQAQDPSRGLQGQLTGGETRQKELAGAGLAETPKTAAEMEKYKSTIQKAAIDLQKAQLESKKAETELQIKQAEASTAKEKGSISVELEQKKLMTAQVVLDTARARLSLVAATGGGKLKEPPLKVKTQLDALDKASTMVDALAKNPPSWRLGSAPQELKELQGALRMAGLSSLASTIPSGQGFFVDTKEMISSIKEGLQSYSDSFKQGVKENYPKYKAASATPDKEDDTDEGGEEGSANPEDGDEVENDGYIYKYSGKSKQYELQGKKP